MFGQKKRGKKRCFFYWCSYTLCIQTIMNTNKVTVSARLLFIRHDARQAALVYIHTPEMSEHRRVSNLGLYILRRGGDKYLSVNDRSKITIQAWFTTLKSFIKKAGQLSFHLINLTIHRKGLPMSVCTLSCGYYEMDSPHMIGKNIWVLFAVWTWIYVHVTKILPSIDVTTSCMWGQLTESHFFHSQCSYDEISLFLHF